MLNAKSEKIQKEKAQEQRRAEEFAELQASGERQEALLNQGPIIEALKVERERADRANRLLPEKQAFDKAKSDLNRAEVALRQANTELAECTKAIC